MARHDDAKSSHGDSRSSHEGSKFPHDDRGWREVLAYLVRQRREGEEILAPGEFIEPIAEAYDYRAAYAVDPERFAFVVIHKGQLDELVPARVAAYRRRLVPVFANAIFVVLGPPDRGEPFASRYAAPLESIPVAPAAGPREGRTAALVTTFERPEALARSLPQIVALGVDVLVVDDGSGPRAAARVGELCERHGARHLRLEANRGLPTALNVGLAWWLGDPDVAWISSFQDDVDVHPETLRRLARVQDARTRPILAGRADPAHPSFGRERVAGVEIVRMRSAPGVHLHAHRDYWASVLPIPTPYARAPKPDGGRPGQGSDEDFWITCWSPRSVVKRGGFVVCVPGLVRTFASQARASTWDSSEHAPDPPLSHDR